MERPSCCSTARSSKCLATNRLDDPIDASPVLVGDQLFLRSANHLVLRAGVVTFNIVSQAAGGRMATTPWRFKAPESRNGASHSRDIALAFATSPCQTAGSIELAGAIS